MSGAGWRTSVRPVAEGVAFPAGPAVAAITGPALPADGGSPAVP